MILCRSASWYVCFVISVRHFLIIKKRKRKKQRCKKNTEVKKKPHQTKKKWKKRRKKEEQNSEVLASFVSFCRVVWLLVWTRSRTSLGRRHRLAWDYFSVLRFWIEILIFLATILYLSKAPQILLSAQVHLTTVTPNLDNWLCRLLGFGKHTCKTMVSRLRYCIPLSPLPSSC